MNQSRRMNWAVTAAALMIGGSVQASLVTVPETNFASPKVTFSEVALGTPVNGLTINGFAFSETIANTSVANGGPGNTTHITQPSALGAANPAGEVITVNLPGMTSEFGFGYAILASGTIADGVTVTLFSGSTNLGSLTYSAIPDPTFPGGFAGIGSTIAFDKVTLAFSGSATAYDFDNISANAAVPEPQTLALAGLALAALGALRRKR